MGPKNGNGDEFRRGLVPTPATTVATVESPSQESVLARVQIVLQREGKSADDLFTALAKSGSAVEWPAFLTLFIELEPALTGQQLQQLWKTFDKDGDGTVSRQEFCRVLDPSSASAQAGTISLPAVSETPAPEAVAKLLQLITEVSGMRAGTVLEQLRAFDKGNTGRSCRYFLTDCRVSAWGTGGHRRTRQS